MSCKTPSASVPYTKADWERLSIVLAFLIEKLPAPTEQDLSRRILEAIDVDSYRIEKQVAQHIQLADEDGAIGPVPAGGGGAKSEPEIDLLSNIVRSFNEPFGNIEWDDADRIHTLIPDTFTQKVAADVPYRNAQSGSDRQTLGSNTTGR
ncbi:MAG: hypothetical protein M3Z66_23140 [Chloroflexota bacterium]|nr:hypothetical protein [Chloroflexota bacterium]